MDGLIILLSLNCWYDWVREAFHDGLDGGVIHCGGRTGVPMCFAGEETFWSRAQRKWQSCLRAIALGSNFLVMSNELHLG
jgi:hypothetical protein